MELKEIPGAFQSKLRLSVVAALMGGPKDFTTLGKLTEATPGNLGKQMELLEAEGFVKSQKEFFTRRPKTTYELTALGRDTLIAYVDLLQHIVSQEES